MEKEFEEYWQKHKDSLYLVAPQALQDELNGAGKMNTAGDWLLQAIPIIIVIWFIEAGFIKSVMLNFLAGAVVGIAFTLLTMLLKPYVTGKRRASDIEADIKTYFYGIYQKQGLEVIEKMSK